MGQDTTRVLQVTLAPSPVKQLRPRGRIHHTASAVETFRKKGAFMSDQLSWCVLTRQEKQVNTASDCEVEQRVS